ncbi:hypothetical protein P3C58_08670 [Mesorhizobium sp. XAP10]|uniref:COG3904 family protein n=1 Tax=unclassified Mesorhizobium TaxID=325217 RepID=UPI0023DEB3B3|nr:MULTISPECIES: hypothetical protein [unclassified Mesorhizobium]MDF3152048.1 hypothetical protein [Mesorhizobium sp. XAP10]MDF3244934.1 hypothetical protein [Mesorhizobium sp. XAP4]
MGRLFWFIAATLLVGHATAAVIEKGPQAAGSPDLITITGVFEPNDDLQFNQVAATTGQAIVVLNSEGGAVLPALEIGRAIRLKGFSTAVASDTLCASACALTWLAGAPRLAGESANIGFHASYVVKDGTASETGVGNALIGAYLNQLGLSQDAIVFVTSAPPEGMAWLSGDKAGELGLQFATYQTQAGSPATVVTQTAPEPYDPMRVAAAFYNALANADGVSAAALVVPEKRGIGPFNEASIHSYFGGLSSPLQLESTARHGADKVAVAYKYSRADGSACDGKAEVQTTYKYGKTLISKIRALSGC